MKISLGITLVILAISNLFGQDYNMGVGLRLGDPSGITLKKYLSDENALELIVGRGSTWWVDYDDRFNGYYEGKGYRFGSFSRRFPIAFQGHYLFHKDFPDAPGLDWYFGFGAQIRLTAVTYNYWYDIDPDPGDEDWVCCQTDQVTDIDIGGDGVIGLEYLIPDSPVTLFLEGGLFVEIIDNPFFIFGQGGIGGRYNF